MPEGDEKNEGKAEEADAEHKQRCDWGKDLEGLDEKLFFLTNLYYEELKADHGQKRKDPKFKYRSRKDRYDIVTQRINHSGLFRTVDAAGDIEEMVLLQSAVSQKLRATISAFEKSFLEPRANRSGQDGRLTRVQTNLNGIVKLETIGSFYCTLLCPY